MSYWNMVDFAQAAPHTGYAARTNQIIATHTLDGFTWAFFWKCLGALQLSALLLALCTAPNSLGRNAWGVFSVFLVWTPAWMPVCMLGLASVGMRPYETLMPSATLAIGGMATAGLATALGARLRLGTS